MTPIRMDRIESGVRTVIAFTEAFNQRDLPAMLQHLAETCLFESPSPAPAGQVYRGKSAISQYWQGYFTRYPHAHLKIEEALGFGMRCISRWTCERTDPSGVTTILHGADLFRLQDGLITEHLSYIKG